MIHGLTGFRLAWSCNDELTAQVKSENVLKVAMIHGLTGFKISS